MIDKNDLRTIIKNKKRRLQKLQERESIEGISTDPGVLLQIENLKSEIQELEKQLESTFGSKTFNDGFKCVLYTHIWTLT